MKDLCILLDDKLGSLAEMGEVLGCSGISIEGGGAAVVGWTGIGQFLFEDGEAAQTALEAKGFTVLAMRDVIVQKLNQDEPGQLGRLTRSFATAGVNIEVLYSDHQHRLILVVGDQERGRQVSEEWELQRQRRQRANSS